MDDQSFHQIGPGVWGARPGLVVVGPAAAKFLERHLAGTPRGRVRICAHRGADAALQEMFILLGEQTYIRPHRHTGKVESLHVISGRADAVFFDDAGAIAAVVPLGGRDSGDAFFYRIDTPQFHTLVLRSAQFFFHEATMGPFRPEETSYASWAPGEDDPGAATQFRTDLERRVRRFSATGRDPG